MGQNRKKNIRRMNNQLIIHCPTSEGVSKVSEGVSEVSERANKCSGGRERSEQSGASERTSEWPSTLVCILGCSGPHCGAEKENVKRERVISLN